MRPLTAMRLIGSIRRPDNIRVLWAPRDIWIGVHWHEALSCFLVYICLVPCLPIRLTWYGGVIGRLLRNRERYDRMRMEASG